jgi:hypothetical protein
MRNNIILLLTALSLYSCSSTEIVRSCEKGFTLDNNLKLCFKTHEIAYFSHLKPKKVQSRALKRKTARIDCKQVLANINKCMVE